MQQRSDIGLAQSRERGDLTIVELRAVLQRDDLALTLGLSLLLSSLTVHFRDLRDLLSNVLTLWFWGTPILYTVTEVPERFRAVFALNPFTHLAVAYQEVLFFDGPFTGWPALLALGAFAFVVLVFGYFVFDRLRDTLAEEV